MSRVPLAVRVARRMGWCQLRLNPLKSFAAPRKVGVQIHVRRLTMSGRPRETFRARQLARRSSLLPNGPGGVPCAMGRRIAVKGASGSGKTTFAAELAERLHLPHIELDALHHGPNWSEPNADEFCARVRAAMNASPDGWVIDGNYERKLDRLVTDAADTVVWLDVPLQTLLVRLWRRTSSRIRGEIELWSGNRESWRTALWGYDSLFLWTIRAFFRHRREWPRRFASHPGFIRLRTPEQAREWLQQQLGTPDAPGTDP
jgi:adenylate kinase family enzyme